jgi:2-polyprenyl-3-methyl-5-hydroxy-6-metoxy-1,4-benzoquinol methylase
MCDDLNLVKLLTLVDQQSNPNLNPLGFKLKDLDNLALNIKFFGYQMARQLTAALPVREGLNFAPVGLRSKPSTQADIESDWVAFWCSELKIPVVFHRKIWELAYVLQALEEFGALKAKARGLGFGCGEEPIASYLAARGAEVIVTDLAPEEAHSRGWQDTAQHATNVERAYKPFLVDRQTFDERVSHRFVDMNAIPTDLLDFDFCWSICALEHLGTIEKGMAFVLKSLDVLKPGGVAAHTTEFNFLFDDETIDNWSTVLPQRKHFLALAERLRESGHTVATLDFDVGNRPLDRFIDIPPFPQDPKGILARFGADHECQHLKMSVDGFPSTCFGLIIIKHS